MAEAPYSPFKRQRRGPDQPQFEHVAVPRKAPPPATDLGLPTPNDTFLQDLTGVFRNSVTDTPNSEDDASSYGGPYVHRPVTTPNGFYNLAQKVTSSVTSFASVSHEEEPATSPRKLSDAELEAEAARDREHSRREAERILLHEAEERRKSEDLLRQPQRGPPVSQNASASRPRRSTLDNPAFASPNNLNVNEKGTTSKESKGWWSMAKHKLTPTKHNEAKDYGMPLTPAQEVIFEAKRRTTTDGAEFDEEDENNAEEHPKSWFTARQPGDASPSAPQGSHDNYAQNGYSPNPASLPLPRTPPRQSSSRLVTPSPNGGRAISRIPVSASPATPPRVPDATKTTQLKISPHQPHSQFDRNRHDQERENLPRPQRMRTMTDLGGSTAPSQMDPHATPLYAQFNPQSGALDVAATLLTVAGRFEKLERWTVNHVRALEERMKDVER